MNSCCYYPIEKIETTSGDSRVKRCMRDLNDRFQKGGIQNLKSSIRITNLKSKILSSTLRLPLKSPSSPLISFTIISTLVLTIALSRYPTTIIHFLPYVRYLLPHLAHIYRILIACSLVYMFIYYRIYRLTIYEPANQPIYLTTYLLVYLHT